MTVIISALTAIILVVFGNQRVALDNQLNNSGIDKIGQLIESTKASASINFNSLVNISKTDDIFKESVTLTDINQCRKDAIASISWTADSRSQIVQLNTSITNPQIAIALGGDCGPGPSTSDWMPLECSNNAATFDFTPGGLTGTGIDFINRGSKSYTILTSSKGSLAKDDFWIVNVTNRTSPTLVSSLNTGPGLNDVDAFGNYAFAANDDTTRQLQVFDITNLNAPALIASRSLPGVSKTGLSPQGRKVFYYNKRVYIGINYNGLSGGNEFHIFDVNNPANPTFLGSYNVNHNIYDIIVRNELIGGATKTIAYLALSATTTTDPELMILDVTNPASITVLGSGFNAPGANQYGTALYALGNKLYFGRQRGTGINYDFYVLNISNPSSITVLSSILLGLKSGTEVRGIIVSSGYAFIATSDSGSPAFQIWNVKNPSSISKVTSCNYPQQPTGLDFDGINLYVANESNEGLRIIYDSTP